MPSPNICVRVGCGGVLLLFLSITAGAQFRASIQGTVTDTSGALVPQATITVTNKETSKTETVTASDEGFYRVTALPPGSYSLTAEKAGYKKKVLGNVSVAAEATQAV